MERRVRWAAYGMALFSVLAWGSSFIATKVVLRDVTPVTVVWLRFAIGVSVMGAVTLARRQLWRPGWKDLVYFALMGFNGITFHQWLQSTGLVTAQATTTAWIVASTPVFIALLGRLVLRESLGWLRIAGIGLAALGVLLVVSRGDFASLAAGRIGTPGDRLILLSAPNWAVFSVLSRRGLERHPAAGMMFFVMAFGWLFSSLLFFGGSGLEEIGKLTLQGWMGVLFLGLACSGLAYVFWYGALQALPASQVGAFLYLEPLAAAIVAAVVLGEPLVWSSLVGGAVILLGVWMVQSMKGKQINA